MRLQKWLIQQELDEDEAQRVLSLLDNATNQVHNCTVVCILNDRREKGRWGREEGKSECCPSNRDIPNVEEDCVCHKLSKKEICRFGVAAITNTTTWVSVSCWVQLESEI